MSADFRICLQQRRIGRVRIFSESDFMKGVLTMKILCVCGFGLGSSMIAKVNVEEICSDQGVEADVDTCDLGSIAGTNADLYVTTRELFEDFPDKLREKTLCITNFVKKKEIAAELLPWLEEHR